MRRTLCVALAGLVILGACGGDDDSSDDAGASGSPSGTASDGSGDRDAYVEAAVSAIGADMEDTAMTEEVVSCIAQATVDAIGVEAFQDAGVTPEEFADSEDIGSLDLDLPDNAVEDLTADLEACNLNDAFATRLVSSFAGLTGQTPEGAEECLAQNMDNSQLASLAAEETLLPSEEEESEGLDSVVATALGACPDALSALVAASLESGLGVALSTESRNCLDTFVNDNAEAVAGGFMSSGESEDPESDVLGTDLKAACPDLAAQLEGAGG